MLRFVLTDVLRFCDIFMHGTELWYIVVGHFYCIYRVNKIETYSVCKKQWFDGMECFTNRITQLIGCM